MAQPPATPQPSWHLAEADISVAAPAARDDAEDLRLASHSPSMLRAAHAAVLEAPSLLKLLLLALVMFAAGGGLGWSSARSSELRDSTIGAAAGLSSSPSPSASGAPLSSSSSASATLTPGVSASLTSSLTPPSTPAVTRPPLPLPSDGPGISRDAARYLVAGQQRVTFLGLGDWGQCSDNSDPIGRSSALNCVRQRSLVASMEAWGVASGAAAVLSLGDSFYDGVSDEADARFTYSWREVYNTPFLRAAPWFVIQGNHVSDCAHPSTPTRATRTAPHLHPIGTSHAQAGSFSRSPLARPYPPGLRQESGRTCRLGLSHPRGCRRGALGQPLECPGSQLYTSLQLWQCTWSMCSARPLRHLATD